MKFREAETGERHALEGWANENGSVVIAVLAYLGGQFRIQVWLNREIVFEG